MNAMKPLCVDLFCGFFLGWTEGFLAEGYRVVGYDVIEKPYRIPDGFSYVRQDVRTLDGHRFSGATCIVASPPCQEFTRLRFLRHNPPPPDMSCVEAVWRIRKESGIPTVLENVEGARVFIGPTTIHRGPWYLWGDVPLLNGGKLPPKVGARPWSSRRFRAGDLLPDGTRPPLQAWGMRKRSGMGAAERSKIPLALARAVARGMLPANPPAKPRKELEE